MRRFDIWGRLRWLGANIVQDTLIDIKVSADAGEATAAQLFIGFAHLQKLTLCELPVTRVVQ